MPVPRAGYMAGAVSGRLLVVGGSYWEGGRKRWSGRADLFDPGANGWVATAPLPEPRSDAACAVVRDSLYVFGGGAENTVRRDALVYRSGRWVSLPASELPAPRLYAVGVANGGRIYVSGGIAKAGDYSSSARSFWVWDTETPAGRWRELPDVPGPGRFTHAMAVRDGRVYVFGGAAAASEDVRNLNDAYRFDPDAQKWTPLPDVPVARRAWWAVNTEHGILLIGGYTERYETEILAYDPASGKTQLAGQLPRPFADAKFFWLGNLLTGAGGETADHVRGRWTVQGRVQPDGAGPQ